MLIHGTAVAVDGRGLLIIGASGAGKSSLALQLMSMGARLVADDRVMVRAANGQLLLGPHENLAGKIEARGIGILNADHLSEVAARLVVDLDTPETARIPPPRQKTILDVSLHCVQKQSSPAFPAAIMQYLKAGIAEN